MKSRGTRYIIIASSALLAGCSPLAQFETGSDRGSIAAGIPIAPTSTPGPGWQRVSFVSGLSVAVPPTAEVAYPQGMDSSLLDITGPGFSVILDDYGPFNGGGTMRLAGRPATEMVRTKDDCRHRVVQVELPEQWPLMSCMPEDKQCRVPNGEAVMHSVCKGAAACGTVDTIISSTQLASEPYSPFPSPDPNWRPPEQPVCSVE